MKNSFCKHPLTNIGENNMFTTVFLFHSLTHSLNYVNVETQTTGWMIKGDDKKPTSGAIDPVIAKKT